MPGKMACIAADTDGQSLRIAGKLLQARKRLAVCAATSCPDIVRDDCVERIADLEASLPTVVFTATNGDGRPLVAVRVTVDGIRIADRLDGRALPVDPGEHLFVFEALGRVSTQMLLTLKEAEKRVRHGVVLRTESSDPAGQVPAPEPSVVSSDDDAAGDLPTSVPIAAPLTTLGASASIGMTTPPAAPAAPGALVSERRLGAIAVGGLGVVEVAIGSIFGLQTIAHWKAATSGCNKAIVCPASTMDAQAQAQDMARAAAKDGSISTAAFVAGSVAIAVGAVLWFSTPGPSKSRRGIRVLPAAGPSQGEFLIRGAF